MTRRRRGRGEKGDGRGTREKRGELGEEKGRK